jgi:hypothetical protein
VLAVTLLALPAQAREVYLNGVKLDPSVAIRDQTFAGCEVRFDSNGDVHITVKGIAIEVQPAGGSTVPATAPAKTPATAPAAKAPATAPAKTPGTAPAAKAPATAPATAPAAKTPTAPGKAPATAPTAPAKAPATAPAVPDKLTKRYWLVSQQARRGAAQYDVDVWINGTHAGTIRSSGVPNPIEITPLVRPGKNEVRFVAVKEGDRRISTSPTDTLDVIIGEGFQDGAVVTIDNAIITWRRTAAENENLAEERAFNGR